MAIKAKFKVSMEDVFPHGAYVVSEVEPVRDFDKSTAARPVQATDKESGLLVWAVSVLDPDPAARKDAKTVTVKISATHQPVPPEAPAGLPSDAGEGGSGKCDDPASASARARPTSSSMRRTLTRCAHSTQARWAAPSTATTGTRACACTHESFASRYARSSAGQRLPARSSRSSARALRGDIPRRSRTYTARLP